MRFTIDTNIKIAERKVKYFSNEHSFSTDPSVREVDFDLSLNGLILSVVDGEIVQIWGYAGHVSWQPINLQIPECPKGSLSVSGEFEYGFTYSIFKETVPIFYDASNQWICIGDPSRSFNIVEFLQGCIAVVDEHGGLSSVWIKLINE